MTSNDQLGNLPSALDEAPAALDSLQEALQMLSASWYRLAADAAPREGISREQEVRLMGALHDVAAAFARCARACRDGHATVTPIVSRAAPAEKAA